VFSLPLSLLDNANDPTPVLLLPDVLLGSDAFPEAVLSLPVVFAPSADDPEAVLRLPVRFTGFGPPSAPVPIPVLLLPSLVSLDAGTCPNAIPASNTSPNDHFDIAFIL
jgi:hypothetical protein